MSTPTATRSGGNRHHGFTLIELMIVMVLMSLFASMAVPAFKDTIARSKRLSALENILIMMSTARSAAVIRDRPIALCPSRNQTSCDGSSWENGILAFVDDGTGSGTGGDRDINGSEEIIAYNADIASGLTIRSTNFSDTGGILFTELGMAEQRGTLVICVGAATDAAAIILNISGQPRMATDDNDDEIVDDDTGTSVTCA